MSTTNYISRIAIPATMAGLCLFVANVSAQLQFSEMAKKRHLPADSDYTQAVAYADVDLDGDPDLIFGNASGQNRLYLNDGTGTFADETAARMPSDSDGTLAAAFADVDLDGDSDLVFGNDGKNRLYLNDGTGTFADATAARMPADTDRTRSVVLADVDGDGDPDLVCGNTDFGGQRQNLLYLNDGTGTFADATAARMPPDSDDTWAVAFADVDLDGDPDLVFGNGGQNRLYLNDGTGTFTDATAARMPPDLDDTWAVALGDVDGDGDVDLACGNDGQNRLCLNDGTGTFTDATAARMPTDSDHTQAVAFADVNLDGDPDLIFGNASGQNRLYLNDGTGTFADETAARMPSDSDGTLAAAFADVDLDGDSDLVFGNDGKNRLYLNDGTGTFTDATAGRMPPDDDYTYPVAFADVDLDGDPDLIFGNAAGQNRLYLNDGTGTFADATAARMPRESDVTVAAAVADVDLDGDPDLIFGNAGGQDRLYLNDGTGTFTDATAGRMPPDSDSSHALAFADVDRDGDPDLVHGKPRLYLNDGSGTFTDVTATQMPPGGGSAVALGDVDLDGDLDLIFGVGGQNRLYLNDGAGTFTDATAGRMPPDSDGTSAVALGDVDGDGDPDLICGNSSYYGGEQNRLYLNDGTGTFVDATAARMPGGSRNTNAVAFADVDLDGDSDLICGNAEGPGNQLYLNDGTGTFAYATARMPGDWGGTNAVAFADVDLDGDDDLVCGNVEQNRLYLNLLRQVDVPFLVRPGFPYQLDAYARYGPTGTVNTAVPFISTGAASTPVPPLGTFALDPAQMIRLSAMMIPQPDGLGSLSFVVPNLPGLVGASVYAQAVIVQYPVLHRLTNWTADVIMQ